MKKIYYIILIISIIFIIIGIFFGNLEEGILKKAINLCLECIGIG